MDSTTVQETIARVRAGVRERAEQYAEPFGLGANERLSESFLIDLEQPLNDVLTEVAIGEENMGDVLGLVTFVCQDADRETLDGTLVVLRDGAAAATATTPAALYWADWVGDGVDGLVEMANEILDTIERVLA